VKGWLPVVLVRWFGKPYGLEDGTIALVGLAAFLGHLWPVFFRFEGGKGVATALGVLLGISGWLGLATRSPGSSWPSSSAIRRWPHWWLRCLRRCITQLHALRAVAHGEAAGRAAIDQQQGAGSEHALQRHGLGPGATS
jgi:hypothetical protein